MSIRVEFIVKSIAVCFFCVHGMIGGGGCFWEKDDSPDASVYDGSTTAKQCAPCCLEHKQAYQAAYNQRVAIQAQIKQSRSEDSTPLNAKLSQAMEAENLQRGIAGAESSRCMMLTCFQLFTLFPKPIESPEDVVCQCPPKQEDMQ